MHSFVGYPTVVGSNIVVRLTESHQDHMKITEDVAVDVRDVDGKSAEMSRCLSAQQQTFPLEDEQ